MKANFESYNYEIIFKICAWFGMKLNCESKYYEII